VAEVEARLLGKGGAGSYKGKILSPRKAAEIMNGWLRKRLDELLPELMTREGFDMWMVISREYNEDPVIMSLLPEPMMYARRRTILVFCLKDPTSVERLTLSRYPLADFYQAVWDPEKEDQWACLGRIVRDKNPRSIGIDFSETFAFGDGLTHTEYGLVMDAIGLDLAARARSAERLCVGWLERRIPAEIGAYAGIVEVAHAIVAEAFSSKMIHPGITTTDDVVWWMRQKMVDIGVKPWFHPSISIQAPGQRPNMPGASHGAERKLIMPGDVLHCDMGIHYLGLCTDTQQNAYVLNLGESDAPAGLKEALKSGNRFQDIVTGEFIAGRTGNEILAASLAKARAEGIKASLYTHPLGVHGHAAGPTIGLWDRQGGVPGNGDYQLYADTCYALELNIEQVIAEWNGQEVRIALEQDVVFTGGETYYLAGRQTEYYLIG
jgi:methionine aminopeptidase